MLYFSIVYFDRGVVEAFRGLDDNSSAEAVRTSAIFEPWREGVAQWLGAPPPPRCHPPPPPPWCWWLWCARVRTSAIFEPRGRGCHNDLGLLSYNGVQELFWLCPTTKERPSPTKCPGRALKKGATSKMVKPEKCARGAAGDSATILHDSNTCQGLPWVPPPWVSPLLASYLDLRCKSAFPWTIET